MLYVSAKCPKCPYERWRSLYITAKCPKCQSRAVYWDTDAYTFSRGRVERVACAVCGEDTLEWHAVRGAPLHTHNGNALCWEWDTNSERASGRSPLSERHIGGREDQMENAQCCLCGVDLPGKCYQANLVCNDCVAEWLGYSACKRTPSEVLRRLADAK